MSHPSLTIYSPFRSWFDAPATPHPTPIQRAIWLLVAHELSTSHDRMHHPNSTWIPKLLKTRFRFMQCGYMSGHIALFLYTIYPKKSHPRCWLFIIWNDFIVWALNMTWILKKNIPFTLVWACTRWICPVCRFDFTLILWETGNVFLVLLNWLGLRVHLSACLIPITSTVSSPSSSTMWSVSTSPHTQWTSND